MKQILSERKAKMSALKSQMKEHNDKQKAIDIPTDIFSQCDQCMSAIYHKDLDKNMYVCPYCNNHFKINSQKRIEITVDTNSFKPLFTNLKTTDPLKMPGYKEKHAKAVKTSTLEDAFLCGEALIEKTPVCIGVLDSYFMMGSMGSVVGEKITRLIEHAEKEQKPLIIFSASGGARMQEGIFSLMQMAKTSGALAYFNQLYISIMTNPTTGGVAASFASLGDINIAERSALIGFAGARVIKQTIGQDLPPFFQTEQFQLEKGQIDLVLNRNEMRAHLIKLIKMHQGMRYES